MADDNPDDIGTLEERIETLAAEIERCRKISLSARLAIALAISSFASTTNAPT